MLEKPSELVQRLLAQQDAKCFICQKSIDFSLDKCSAPR